MYSKGDPKLPPTLCGKWQSACHINGAKMVPSVPSSTVHQYMHSYHAMQVNQGCTHLQQSLPLHAGLNPPHLPPPRCMYNHSNHAHIVSEVKCFRCQRKFQLIQPHFATQSCTLSSVILEWLARNPTLPVTPSYNMTTATLLIRLEIKLSPMVLDMCSVLPGIHLLHI